MQVRQLKICHAIIIEWFVVSLIVSLDYYLYVLNFVDPCADGDTTSNLAGATDS
jgi:hypothetical protein